MLVQSTAVIAVGLLAYVGLGRCFDGTIRPHEQLRGALLAALLFPVL